MRREAVVTGIGVVAPGAVGTTAFWDMLTAGRTATRAVTLFDPAGFRSRIAAEVDFDPAAHGLDAEQVARMDRYVQFTAVALAEALADSGTPLEGFSPWRLGVSMGTAVGGTTLLEKEYVTMSRSGADWVVDPSSASPHLYRALTPSMLSGEVAELVGARGPVQTVSTGCTSGLDAVGYAAQAIEDDLADVVVTGAAESPISPIAMACFDAIKATSDSNDDPEHASRPFDRHRNGFVMGEGAAVLVLEEASAAKRRGADIRCRVAGFANHGNAFHMTGLRREGTEMARAITTALDRARRSAEDVDYVNAHGSGTVQNDRHETDAVKRALGAHARRVPMSSIKSMVGHSLGAIGSIELAACVLAMDTGVVPPTANLTTPDPECDLDHVPLTAREQRNDVVLSVGSGFGGFQSAVVLDRGV
ncbi:MULTISPECIES: beta-ketoacyl-[acyl-carrier-protein] synthase family protein [Nocardiopsis]|uniref:Beta-ketoacyl-ACP synthase II n=1 Tax=Nocardiopsis alba TaxID=53437 RepID=A0A7K2IP17_9ACTN|nr:MULTISPECIES: beta-ketoacyl-[acyl-carrier-protein] synthase family protein [Nocardiopsis]MEC3894096.1 beta-ketoacyl-[acyl-carrier-protein] synthase family protein [Nocardiopsis sp. LDBS1602]MYR31710.1 beta-ketoacyl-ACP synthase II [Nocardiopsis alba]